MQFLDKVVITVESGKGGDGCVSGRRETGVPFGGPSGGNGGHGGSIILKASKDVNTLLAYKYKKYYKADDGEPGRSKDQYGANAQDLVLEVPVGTMISDVSTKKVLHYFDQDGEQIVLLQGGENGIGNMEFTTSTLQYPHFALLGEPGQKIDIELELQLMGDVALVGSPSVGKSTLINALANTKAKVADYHFTTLVPHLGSIKTDNLSFNLIDIPGLIKGASDGKGLGNEFLRHVLKAKIFCIMMDMYNFDKGIQEGIDLLTELFLFIQNKLSIEQKLTITIGVDGSDLLLNVRTQDDMLPEYLLMTKQIMFAFNKFDLIQDAELIQEYISSFKSTLKKITFADKFYFASMTDKILDPNIFVISGATHYHLEDMMDFWVKKLKNRNRKEYTPEIQTTHIKMQKDVGELIKEITEQEKGSLIDGAYLDEMEMKFTKVWLIDSREFAKIVYTLQWGNDEAEMRFWSKIEQEGFLEILKQAGVRKGDVLKIKSYYPGYKDRYVQW